MKFDFRICNNKLPHLILGLVYTKLNKLLHNIVTILPLLYKSLYPMKYMITMNFIVSSHYIIRTVMLRSVYRSLFYPLTYFPHIIYRLQSKMQLKIGPTQLRQILYHYPPSLSSKTNTPSKD